jgi:16S rRNA (uracil1498-N3)-methyltransferase
MQVFFSNERQENFLILDEIESKHCVRVLRKKEGDEIHVLNGEGGFFQCTIFEANKNRTVVEIQQEEQQGLYPGMNTIIALAPTKNMSRVEWFLEKATEIGIGGFAFFFSKNSERSKLRYDRLEKVVQSACKQSLKAYFPFIEEAKSFSDLISNYQGFNGQKFIAHCGEGEKSLLKSIYEKGTKTLVLIGPEGDFTPEEVAEAQASGFVPLSFGSARLRTETAALVACHSIQFLEM